jgi:hypothetical protein
MSPIEAHHPQDIFDLDERSLPDQVRVSTSGYFGIGILYVPYQGD